MTSLVLEGLTKRFGAHLAVDGLDLSVAQGEFVSLLGPSGCGKTTTLQMIAGFVDPTAGRILLGGTDISSVAPSRRGLGIVFQSYALFPHMTAAENVAFGLEMRKVGKAEREKRVRETLALVGLSGFEERFPRRMSGGQQQRVALARALVIEPSVLLLDEPLSNLDAKLREEMQIELRLIQRRLGTTTLLVTHDQGEAMALSDRIVVMNAGRAEQIAPPHEAYERPATAFVASFLGKTNRLEGTVRDGTITIGGVAFPAPPVPSGPAVAIVRPERIALASPGAGLAGRIATRVFQGSHWMLHVETAIGPVLVIRQNAGDAVPAEGEAVGLVWQSADMAIRQVAAA
ncbi:ABC transporter ATP-binding protein [Elioraea rosea]|uniref:ABC transporter ATP-binding protein n=1 Tax=Elioraea rosea TaxID=2492390 RepID=UPI0011842694|nr:ABC transporter ATP-binding protein [Elioraea rosea]